MHGQASDNPKPFLTLAVSGCLTSGFCTGELTQLTRLDPWTQVVHNGGYQTYSGNFYGTVEPPIFTRRGHKFDPSTYPQESRPKALEPLFALLQRLRPIRAKT